MSSMSHTEPPMRHYSEIKTPLWPSDLRAIIEHLSLLWLWWDWPTQTYGRHICVKQKAVRPWTDSTSCLRSAPMFTKYPFTSGKRPSASGYPGEAPYISDLHCTERPQWTINSISFLQEHSDSNKRTHFWKEAVWLSKNDSMFHLKVLLGWWAELHPWNWLKKAGLHPRTKAGLHGTHTSVLMHANSEKWE